MSLRSALSLLPVLACAPAELPDPPDTDAGRDTSTPELVQSGVISCAEPDRRDAAPFDRLALGPEWEREAGADPEDPAYAGGLAVADLDGDGWLDVALAQDGLDLLLLGRGDGAFEDASDRLWPDAHDDGSESVTAVDVDGDADLDLFVCTDDDAANRLFLNDGAAGFTDASDWTGLAEQTRHCNGSAWGDMDGDGDLDLALATQDPCQDERPGQVDCDNLLALDSPGMLWERTDAGLRDASALLDRDTALASFLHQASWLDVEGDGDADLYWVADDRVDIEFAGPNVLWENGDGFIDVSKASGAGVSIEGMGLGVGDLNGDGLPDLLVPGILRYALLESAGPGQWVDTTLSRGLVLSSDDDRWTGWGTELADLDNDGDLDAMVVFGKLYSEDDGSEPFAQPDALYLQGDDGQFSQVAERWGVADDGLQRGLVLADLNRDGWLDVIKRDVLGPTVIHQSRCGAQGWLRVGLQAAGPNPFGVGARVRVVAGEESWVRWLQVGGTGFVSSGPLELHFGLGDVDTVDRVEVSWPDGTVQQVGPVQARQVIGIRHPSL